MGSKNSLPGRQNTDIPNNYNMNNVNSLSREVQRKRENFPRKKVNIPGDCWLDALKFLACSEWLKMRYVSRPINGIVERNISRLPRAIIEKAELTSSYLDQEAPLVAYDAIIHQRRIAQWFVNRGITINPLVGITLENAVVSRTCFSSEAIHLSVVRLAQKDNILLNLRYGNLISTKFKGVMLYAQFRSSNRFSLSSLEQFLTFIFHPLSYIKEVQMYPVNQRIVDVVKDKFADHFPVPGYTTQTQKFTDNKPPFIRCKTFTLLYDTQLDDVFEPLKWLERNVRADYIVIKILCETSNEKCVVVSRQFSNYVLGVSQSAIQEIKVPYPKLNIQIDLFNSLIEKFWTLPPIECETSTIVMEPFDPYSLTMIKHSLTRIKLNLGPNLVNREVDSQGAQFLYILENGPNRMRISFCDRRSEDHVEGFMDWFNHAYVKFYATQPSF